MRFNNIDQILHSKYGRTSKYKLPTYKDQVQQSDFYDYVEYKHKLNEMN